MKLLTYRKFISVRNDSILELCSVKIIHFYDLEHFLIRTIQIVINILLDNNIDGKEDEFIDYSTCEVFLLSIVKVSAYIHTYM